MIVFCHIPKTAGMAVKHVLKSRYGLRFLSSTTWGKSRPATTEADLRHELLAYPGARAIGGHGMRPFVDYGARGEGFRWFTILRDARSRLISHYVYDLEHGRAPDSFEAWLASDVANYQVRWIAGEEDLGAAKALLDAKFEFVGFQEHFRESLVLLNHALFEDTLPLHVERPVNATRSVDVKDRVRAEMTDHAELVAAAIGLDEELYRFAYDQFWTPAVAAMGEDALAKRVARGFAAGSPEDGKMNRMLHDLHRSGVYKPLLVAAKVIGARG